LQTLQKKRLGCGNIKYIRFYNFAKKYGNVTFGCSKTFCRLILKKNTKIKNNNNE